MALFVSQPGRLIEPSSAPEIICSGLGRIEFLGAGLACFVLYRNGIAPDTGDLEQVVCGRVFAPMEAVPGAVDLMLRALLEAGMARAAVLSRRMLS